MKQKTNTFLKWKKTGKTPFSVTDGNREKLRFPYFAEENGNYSVFRNVRKTEENPFSESYGKPPFKRGTSVLPFKRAVFTGKMKTLMTMETRR